MKEYFVQTTTANYYYNESSGVPNHYEAYFKFVGGTKIIHKQANVLESFKTVGSFFGFVTAVWKFMNIFLEFKY